MSPVLDAYLRAKGDTRICRADRLALAAVVRSGRVGSLARLGALLGLSVEQVRDGLDRLRQFGYLDPAVTPDELATDTLRRNRTHDQIAN